MTQIPQRGTPKAPKMPSDELDHLTTRVEPRKIVFKRLDLLNGSTPAFSAKTVLQRGCNRNSGCLSTHHLLPKTEAAQVSLLTSAATGNQSQNHE